MFGPTLVDELQARAFDFDLQVQLCTDLNAMPVNDATVEWPEKLSPFVTVGRVHLPRQDISGPENFEKGDALAFNQWRVTADHRPLGRDHEGATHLHRVSQGPPHAQPPAANRAHQRRRGAPGIDWPLEPESTMTITAAQGTHRLPDCVYRERLAKSQLPGRMWLTRGMLLRQRASSSATGDGEPHS